MLKKKRIVGMVHSALVALLVGAVVSVLLSVPVSAEGKRVPVINTAAGKAAIVAERALAEASIFVPVEIVVEVSDGAFFLLTSGGGSDARQAFLNALYAELKEQLHVGAIIVNYESFSVVEVTAAAAERVEPILASFIDSYVVSVFFWSGGAYSFAW